jgi:hypothetical protein
MKGLNVKKINLGREIKYTLSSLLEWLNYLPGADRIETANYPVWSEELPEAFDGLRIAVLSDLHGHVFGKHQKRLEKAVREAKPDLILVAGDWVRFDYRGRDKRAILDAVRALTKIAPVFGNFGNHEALADHREAMAEELKAEGVSSAIINLGGNLLVIGSKPDGKPYAIGVLKPEAGSSENLATFRITDASAVTSGSYQRFFEQDGVTYHHILDPTTGLPAESGLKSVTVVAKSSAVADILSTSFFVMGEAKAGAFWENCTDIDVYFVDEALNVNKYLHE